MTDRRSDKHSPSVDDGLTHDFRSMLQGAPIESRAQEQRLQEGGATSSEHETVIDLRSEVAAVLRPSSFPRDRKTLIRTAMGEEADERLVSLLKLLPEDTTFENFEAAWEAVAASGGKSGGN